VLSKRTVPTEGDHPNVVWGENGGKNSDEGWGNGSRLTNREKKSKGGVKKGKIAQ